MPDAVSPVAVPLVLTATTGAFFLPDDLVEDELISSSMSSRSSFFVFLELSVISVLLGNADLPDLSLAGEVLGLVEQPARSPAVDKNKKIELIFTTLTTQIGGTDVFSHKLSTLCKCNCSEACKIGVYLKPRHSKMLGSRLLRNHRACLRKT